MSAAFKQNVKIIKITVFWDVLWYSVVARYRVLEESTASIFRAEEWMQQAAMKPSYCEVYEWL
jgi:hypothetical protein